MRSLGVDAALKLIAKEKQAAGWCSAIKRTSAGRLDACNHEKRLAGSRGGNMPNQTFAGHKGLVNSLIRPHRPAERTYSA
jgi:hypothetical protein